jgi:hypothetical protein
VNFIGLEAYSSSAAAESFIARGALSRGRHWETSRFELRTCRSRQVELIVNNQAQQPIEPSDVRDESAAPPLHFPDTRRDDGPVGAPGPNDDPEGRGEDETATQGDPEQRRGAVGRNPGEPGYDTPDGADDGNAGNSGHRGQTGLPLPEPSGSDGVGEADDAAASSKRAGVK